MRLKGMSVGLTDCDAGVAEEFNRWYDLDHVPENIALPEIVTARRYVCTPDLKQGRGAPEVPALANGGGAYAALYFIGVDDIAGTGVKMKQLFDDLLKQRRIFRKARITYSDRFKLVRTYSGKNVPPLAPEAVPYLGHTGILLSLTAIPDASRRAEVEAWWDATHIPDIVSVPGVLGALRFESILPENDRRVMFLFLTDGDPKAAQANISAASKTWAAQGRIYAPDKRPHKTLFSSPYRAITPLKYDFLKT